MAYYPTTFSHSFMAHTPAETNAIAFPTARSKRYSVSEMSMVSTRATALDVCYSVYGEAGMSADAVDRFYEANATYENPFVTATSRSVIGDIHSLSRQLSSVDVPRPLAVLCTLFRIRPSNQDSNEALFQALRVWTDVGDICENESFDGHRKAMVEHTLNVLLLPGIHCEGPISHAHSSSDSLVNLSGSPLLHSQSLPFISPSLPIPGTSLSVPSPLHCKLRIITRLSFNEQGLVTHHRDIWDVKDIMGLLPGVSLAQWVGTRLAAAGLSYAARILPRSKARSYAGHSTEQPYSPDAVDLEYGMAQTPPL